jgi:phage head maturation protease
MKLTTPMQITAADSESRTISGRIVAFNENANASTGKVVFAKGSIAPKDVFLNLEHDRTRRIGKTLSMTMSGDKSIDATFKIANTTAGNDALVEAMDGLRDGFSVELAVNDYEMQKDGTMKVLSGDLTGVALTSEPAIRSARVSSVAATEDENSETETKSEADQTKPTEGENAVSDTTVETPAASAETVEASLAIKATGNIPVAYTKVRNPIQTTADYLFHSIQATRGDHDSREYIAATNNSTGDNPGLIPTRQLSEVVNGLANSVRASIDSISTGTLPDAGLHFEIPKITQLPSVAVTPENDPTPNVNLESEFITVDVKKFSGSQVMSVELQDRSSPAFLNEILSNLNAQYARATNAYNSAQILASATNTAFTLAGATITASELLDWVSKGAVSVYANTFRFADAIVVSPSMWGTIMSMNVDGRPIYNALQPQNAAGNAQPRSLRGSVNGIDLWVDTALNAAQSTDGCMYVINRDAYTWYESPTLQLRTNLIADGQIGVMLYGYGATATKIGAGAYKFNKA